MRILRPFAPLLAIALLSSAALITSCSELISPKNPYERSDAALDPSKDENWPENWQSSTGANLVFESFIRHAERSPEWILLSHQGEAVYVRPADHLKMSVRYQGGSNKVERMTINGNCEALSLRKYARCTYLKFDSEAGDLKLTTVDQRQNYMYGKTGEK